MGVIWLKGKVSLWMEIRFEERAQRGFEGGARKRERVRPTRHLKANEALKKLPRLIGGDP